MDREPIRLVMIPSALLVAALAAAAVWGFGADPRWAVGAAAVAAAGWLGLGEFVRGQVTPTSDPRDDAGRPLVPKP